MIRRTADLSPGARDGFDAIIDVRSPAEFALDHLPGAINLPLEWVDERAPSRVPDLDTEIVVYCIDLKCESSVFVGERLRFLGYTNVRHYADGKADWMAAGLPLERGGI